MQAEHYIDTLQEQQRVHDELAHIEILNLPLDRRVTHMVLHFAKYAGRLIAGDRTTEQEYRKLVVDTAIICLATANALAMRLSVSPLVTKAVSAASNDLKDPREMGLALATPMSEMAKAVESLDHLEDYPYRRVLEDGTARIAAIAVRAARSLNLDLESEIRAAWKTMEENRDWRDSNLLRTATSVLREAS